MVENKTSPLHVQIKNDMIAKIDSGEWAPGTKLGKELDLAASYGVSRITIRQALGNLAAQGYIERVKRRGSVVSAGRKSPRKGGWVGMVTYDPFNYLVQETMAGAEKTLAANGLSLRLYSTQNSPERTETVIGQAVNDGADGLLIFSAEDTTYSAVIHDLKNRDYPICLFDRPLMQVMTDCVMTDHVEGGFIATTHLIEMGHRRIGFVSGVDPARTYPVGARYEGYRAAMVKAGLTIESDLAITGCSGDMAWVSSLHELLVSDKRPTAIFAVNDIVAATVLQTAMSLGLAVPKDLAIVGFDNTDVVAKFNVPLTTVEQPFREIGAAAITLLLDRMNGIRTNIAWTVIPPKLVVRASSTSLPCTYV